MASFSLLTLELGIRGFLYGSGSRESLIEPYNRDPDRLEAFILSFI